MCGASAPSPPPKLPEAPRAPDVSAGAGGDSDARRKRAAGGKGRSTILTSSRGVQDGGATTQKTLLGQ